MSVVGFNFRSIQAEKKGKASGKVSIRNNISVKNVQTADIAGSTDSREAVRVSFEFVSSFDPDIGAILLNADVLLMEEAEKKKALLSSWSENNSIPEEFVEPLFNLVLKKCNIKALNLADDLRLPSPIQMGKVKVKEPQE